MYRIGELVYINLESFIFSSKSHDYPYEITSTMIRFWNKHRTRKFVIIYKEEDEKDYYRIGFSNEEGECNSSEDEEIILENYVWHKDWLSYFPSTLVPSVVYGMYEDIRKFCEEQCIMKCLGEEDNRECLLKKYHPKAF